MTKTNMKSNTVLFFCTVICNFRSPICQALVLEIGETVQILEKSEGKDFILID